jgi:DNA-binding protein H-NS
MATYKELQDQIAKLQMDAEEARSKEIEGALGQIKALMEEYGLTVEDIGSLSKKKGPKASQKTSVQFKDDAGNTWSGRGRMPAWLKGKDKEQFRVR